MSVILCYGDSNTHGTRPMRVAGLSERHPKGARWPDALAVALGADHEVISEGLPGRTTVHEDHVEGGERNGYKILPAILHSHKPIDLLLVMLGTNDLKPRFSVTANEIARSVERLVRAARAEGVTRAEMIVCPAPVRETGCLATVFAGAEARQAELALEMRAAADRLDCGYIEAGDYVTVSDRDGVHWEAEEHLRFGDALAEPVKKALRRLR